MAFPNYVILGRILIVVGFGGSLIVLLIHFGFIEKIGVWKAILLLSLLGTVAFQWAIWPFSHKMEDVLSGGKNFQGGNFKVFADGKKLITFDIVPKSKNGKLDFIIVIYDN